MVTPEPKQGEEWETESLLPQYTEHTQTIQLPVSSRSRLVRWRRVIKLGGLLTFAAAVLITTFVLIPRYFWSSFKRFGPAEPQDNAVSWRKSVSCKDHARWWDSEVVEYNRRWSTYTNLTVPLDEEGLLLLVEGGVYGSVDFVEDDSLVNEAYVNFYIEHDGRQFRNTDFCTLDVYDGSTGVGIFSPPSGGLRATMARITVHLPKFELPKMKKMVVAVPDMEVNFPSDFGIKSRSLSVRSKKAPSHVTNVECEYCDISVSDGPISGNFVVRHELILKTKSGAVDANITMISNSTNTGLEPSVDITTTTGPINADFTLVAIDPETEEEVPSGGFFRIATRSRHAPVRLEVVDAPVDSALVLSTKNVRGPLDVFLHPTFQGKFTSETLIGDTPLGIRGYAEDPAGDGKKRNLVWGGSSIPPGVRHVMSGEVWWGDRPGPPHHDGPPSLVYSAVQLMSIVGQPQVFLHLTNPNATSISMD